MLKWKKIFFSIMIVTSSIAIFHTMKESSYQSQSPFYFEDINKLENNNSNFNRIVECSNLISLSNNPNESMRILDSPTKTIGFKAGLLFGLAAISLVAFFVWFSDRRRIKYTG